MLLFKQRPDATRSNALEGKDIPLERGNLYRSGNYLVFRQSLETYGAVPAPVYFPSLHISSRLNMCRKMRDSSVHQEPCHMHYSMSV